jgi:threonine aldolase
MTKLIYFQNDYSEGAHPAILEALARNSLDQQPGYGRDKWSLRAGDLIRELCDAPDAEIHLISGGTQTNVVACAAFLKPYESIIAGEAGHICVHETGAIEATGHKIHPLRHTSGMIASEQIREVVAAHNNEHMVKPKMVFISQSTELGTVYTKKELESISNVCRELGLLLYMDGARLGVAMTCHRNDLSFADIARLVDVFYIGGTKNGALFGEALVITNPTADSNIRYHLKQRGALLAKGRALGAQFEALFTDNLFLSLASHTNKMAMLLANGLSTAGFTFAHEPTTNQIFPILPNELVAQLQNRFAFYVWGPADLDASVVRLVTSWATTEEDVGELLRAIA